MARGLHQYSGQEAANVVLGQGGWDIVTNAAISAHTYVAITILTGTEILDGEYAAGTVTATSVDLTLGDTLTTVEVPVGCTIYGRWSVVTIGANDTAIVYRG